jgi:aspartate racemase
LQVGCFINTLLHLFLFDYDIYLEMISASQSQFTCKIFALQKICVAENGMNSNVWRIDKEFIYIYDVQLCGLSDILEKARKNTGIRTRNERSEFMKTIGLIGGMSWESTVTYYQLINEMIKERMGGFHSAKILLYSVDFQEIEECQSKGEWEKSADILVDAAQRLEKGGADFLVICTNTMHKVVPQIQAQVGLPILHIAKAAADELLANNIKRVALLGTKYTMQQDFYKEKLIDAGLEVLIPTDADVEIVNRVIYDELCLGVISEESRREYVRIIEQLTGKGAQGVILGCTEIGLLIRQEHTSLPIFDTTHIHARKAVELAAGKQ